GLMEDLMALAVTDLEIVRQSPEDTARTMSSRHYRAAYDHGMSLSQHLENLDPTAERQPHERFGDAFDRVVAASGIIVNPVPEMGLRASTWEEAIDTPQKRALMPELASRWWKRAARLPVSAGVDRAEMTQLMNAGEDLDGYE